MARQLAAPAALFPLTAPDALRAELGRIREDGYALDTGEENPDVCCVAAPVATRSDVVGAISVVGPCARLRRQQDGLIPIVLEVARAIGALLKAAAGHEQPAAAGRLEPEEATQAAIETALATLTQAMSRVG